MNYFVGFTILVLFIATPVYFTYKGFAKTKECSNWFSRKIFYFWFIYALLVVIFKITKGTSESLPFITSTVEILGAPIVLTVITVKVKQLFTKKNKD